MITDVNSYMASINEAADYISSKIEGKTPEICIVLGSGLSPLADMCEDSTVLPYKDIPGFPVSTVPGHDGKLIIGTLEDKRVFMMSGRFHYYEGYDTSVCTLYVRVMSKLGVKILYLTNAAGGLKVGMNPSDLMIITDHIPFFCESPLRGPNLDEFGDRFPDQSYIYDPEYVLKLTEIAKENGINAHRGVYAYTKGPQYETPAEIRALSILGADAVGMSTVPEAIVASHCGMRIAAVSCICNYGCGIADNKLSHKEVMEVAGKASEDSCKLAKLFVKSL